MELKTAKLQNHFYLYCALFYNKNRTINYNDVVVEASAPIISVLENLNFKKFDMPMHSYHYLMGLYNPEGYDDNGKVMKLSQEVINYIEELAGIPQLQAIFNWQEAALDIKLAAYKEKFAYIEKYFKAHYDFEPADSKFFLTRNWDASGKCIHTKEGTYIFVGWRIKGLNLKQILHEITHSFINECTLPVPANIKADMEKMPRYVLESYADPVILAVESFIRALVVYFDHLEGSADEFVFNDDDLSMLLPAKYLHKLQKDKVTILTKNYINNLYL